MARGRGKFFGLWLIFLGAALYLPFRQYLENQQYASAEEFFEELLIYTLLAAVVLFPLAIYLARGFKKRSKLKQKKYD